MDRERLVLAFDREIREFARLQESVQNLVARNLHKSQATYFDRSGMLSNTDDVNGALSGI